MSINSDKVAADQWEGDEIETIDAGKVRRIEVPGGWLYQVEIYSEEDEIVRNKDGEEKGERERSARFWSQPVFVPRPSP